MLSCCFFSLLRPFISVINGFNIWYVVNDETVDGDVRT